MTAADWGDDKAKEATIQRLIEENRNLRTTVDADLEYQRRLEARLAAVEALVDEWDKSGETHEWILAADLRAALTDKENNQ